MATELSSLTDEQIIEQVSHRVGSQKSWMAIDELARRALENHELIDAALNAIAGDRAIKLRYIPHGSHMAVGRILQSGDEHVIRRLLQEMSNWNGYEQKDAISPWAGHKRLPEATQELRAAYGWHPKYTTSM